MINKIKIGDLVYHVLAYHPDYKIGLVLQIYKLWDSDVAEVYWFNKKKIIENRRSYLKIINRKLDD